MFLPAGVEMLLNIRESPQKGTACIAEPKYSYPKCCCRPTLTKLKSKLQKDHTIPSNLIVSKSNTEAFTGYLKNSGPKNIKLRMSSIQLKITKQAKKENITHHQEKNPSTETAPEMT